MPALSLTPNPDTEREDLRHPLTMFFVETAIKQHGLDPTEFWDERGGWQVPVRLRELRDWLGY